MVSTHDVVHRGRNGSRKSTIEASVQERRVMPVVWRRKGGVQRGFEMGKRRVVRSGRGNMRRREESVRRM